ncbi:hypothetical protein ES703_35979 [subsurface metagenome]
MASETQNLSRLSPNVVVGDPDGTCLSHRDHHRPNAIRCTLYAVLNMQNKPNFPKSQMNVKTYNTTDYENIANWTLGENKPNSNPIKPNFHKAQMNVNLTLTKDYRKNDDFAVRKNKPNSKPISSKPKMNANVYVIEDYENETTFRPQKNKPNSNPISKQLVGSRPRWAESAKMAQQIDVLKHQNTILKKSNFLYPNRLNSLNQHNPPTGTSFAYLEYMR